MGLHVASGHTPRDLLCFGASGTGGQISLDVAHQATGVASFVGYVDDEKAGEALAFDDRPVIALDDVHTRFPGAGVFVAVHSPKGRRQVFARIRERRLALVGTDGVAHLRHPSVVLGEGVIVPSTTRVGPSTRLGRGVLALSDLIAHDVTVGEFTTLAATSVILGHVSIGEDVWIGAGAVVGNGTVDRPVVIGDAAVVGAGAVVRGDVAPGEVVVGPRAASPAAWSGLRALLRDRRR